MRFDCQRSKQVRDHLITVCVAEGSRSVISCCQESRYHPQLAAHIWQARCSSLQFMSFSYPSLAISSHQKVIAGRCCKICRPQHRHFATRLLLRLDYNNSLLVRCPRRISQSCRKSRIHWLELQRVTVFVTNSRQFWLNFAVCQSRRS